MRKSRILCLLILFYILLPTGGLFFQEEYDQILLNPRTSDDFIPFQEWNVTHGYSNLEKPVAAKTDSLGNTYICGYTYSNTVGDRDCFIVKISKTGSVEWDHTWGTSNQDYFTEILIDSNNNIYCIGIRSSRSCIVSYNSSGNIQWYDVWGSGISIYGAVLDSKDDVYISGYYRDGGLTYADTFLLKYNKTGDLIWSKINNENKYDFCYGLSIDLHDNIYQIGKISNSSYTVTDCRIIKYDKSGNQVWVKTWGGSGHESYSDIIINSNNEIYVGGFTDSFGSGKRDLILHKYNESGVLLWEEIWGGSENECYPDLCMGLAFDSLENICFTAETDSYGLSNICLLKYNSSGALLWEEIWGTVKYDSFPLIAIDSQDNIYLTGRIYGSGIDDDGFIVKYDAQGVLIWEKIWGGNNDDYSTSIIFDHFGNLLIVGTTKSYGAGSSDIILMKFYTQPFIKIKTPISNQVFGLRAPDYEILIFVPENDSIWYSIDGKFNHTISDLSGTINQTDWDFCNQGQVIIEFFTNDSTGAIYSDKINVFKNLVITIVSPDSNQMYGIRPPQFEISLIDWDLYNKSYSLNGGDNYTYFGSIAFINQTAWDLCNNGSVFLIFYAKYNNIFTFFEISLQKNIFLKVLSPSINQTFGRRAPIFEITLLDWDLYDTKYSLNGGENYTFTGINGIIDKNAWGLCGNGSVIISFYAKNPKNETLCSVIEVFKDYSILNPKRAYALIIGISNYPGTNNDLFYPASDANSIFNYLRFECNFKEVFILKLLNVEATFSGIHNAFVQIRSSIEEDDLFFFYFSGHGGYDDDTTQFICPYDSIPYNPAKLYYDAALDMELDLMNCDEKYIMIDSCNSGGMIPETQSPNRFIISACNDDELSWETSELHHGVFTYFFLESSQLAPDINADGILSIEEQFSYAYSETVDYSSLIGATQHPQKYDGISGSAIIQPFLSIVSINFEDNVLNYSFILDGHGEVLALNLTVCSISPNISIDVFGLMYNSSSNTGFGLHSGQLNLNEDFNISGCEILAKIEGYQVITLNRIFGDTDGDNLPDLIEIRSSNTNPLLNDTDFDKLSDFEEFYGVTNPLDNDTDNDGIADGYEVFYGLNPLVDDSTLDFDNDGLTNLLEFQIGTIANNPDTDGDSMPDGWEVVNLLNPLLNDSASDPDNDDLLNGLEFTYHTNPNLSDTDSDGLSDGEEVLIFYTNPNLSDTDSDGLFDGEEVNIYNTDPLTGDTDADSMPDGWEVINLLNPLLNDSALDPDNDLLINIEEYDYDTDPNNPDTDGDTWTDYQEIQNETDPNDPNDFPISPGGGTIPGYDHFLILFSILSLVILLKNKTKQN